MNKIYGFFLILICGSALAQPVDNPYKTFYPNASIDHWSDSIKWSSVWNISDFQDTTMVARYNKARDFVADQGGGVLFFPSGTYNFENSIQFKSGVVIRGETPVITLAKDSMFAPPTRFVFPKYIPSDTGTGTANSTAFKSISSLPNTSNSGIVYIDVDRASVSLRSQTFLTVQTPRGSTSQSQERNRNLIIFGVRSNNVASPYNTVPSAKQRKWQRFSSPFASNLSLFAWKNACIANCRINDFERNEVHPIPNLSFEQPGYLADRTGNAATSPVDTLPGYQAVFSYTDHHGVSVNRKATISNATPEEEPDNFRSGLEVRDNWIFKTMRVGIICSGLGIIVDRNQILDRAVKQTWLHPIGTRIASNNAATYENRGIDFGGWNVQITRNDITVVRHKIYNGPYYSVDGEGILLQECCGGTSVNGARITNNNTHNTYIGFWKVRSINNVVIDSNDTGNEPIILTANVYSSSNKFWFYTLNNIEIKGNKGSGIEVDGNRGGRNLLITGNTGTGNSTISAPCFAQIENNTGFSTLKYTAVKDTTFGSIVQTVPCQSDTLIHPFVELISPLAQDTSVQAFENIYLKTRWKGGKVDSVYFYENVKRIGAFGPNQTEMMYQLGACNSSVSNFYWATVKDTARKMETRSEMKRVVIPCITAISEPTIQKEFKIYPNPGSGFVFIENGKEGGLIQISDLVGRKIKEIKIEKSTLDIGFLKNGIYIFTPKYATENKSFRFIKE